MSALLEEDLDPILPVPPVRTDVDDGIGGDLEGQLDGRVLVQRMMRASLAFFASEVIRGDVSGDNTPTPTIIARHHEEWGDLIRNHQQICVIAPRDHGKCSVAGHLILRSDGTRIPIEQWQGGEVWAYDPSGCKLVLAQASPAHSNGKKRCLRIKTRTGREETVTRNHPLRMLNDWVHAEDLKVGNRIAVPRELAVDGQHPVEDAWLLGALVGDGSLKVSTVVGICMTEPSMIEAVRLICERRCWTLSNSTDNDFRLTNGWCKEGSAQEWLKPYGLVGSGSHTKRVPQAIFTAPRADVAEFVAGYLDTDGSVNPHGGGCVSLGSVSKELLRDVQHLLVRLGVVAVLNQKRGTYKGERHLSWGLHIRGKSILRLAKWVRLRNKPRADALAEIVQLQELKLEGGSVDLLPKDVYALLEKSEDWHKKHGTTRFNRQYELTRTKALALAAAEDNAELEKIASAEILWDEITEIEDVGEHETYFITVPGLESYVGDDIINHNSHLLTVALPIWEGWRRPGCVIVIFSETQPQAEQQLGKLKDEVENNPRLAHLVDSAVWSATKIRFTNGTTIYARGFGSKVRGMHPHLIVCDDIVSEAAAYSQLIRDRQATTFFSAVRNMLVPNGTMVVAGTPQSADDLYGRLAKTPGWYFVRYQAVDKDGSILFPERYDRKRLHERKTEIGEIRFAREYLGLPVSSGMSLFPDELVSGEPFLHSASRLGMFLEDGSPARAWWVARGVDRFYAGVDIAISSNVGTDFFVIFVVGLDAQGNRWVVDIHHQHGMDYKAQKAKIREVAKVWRVEIVTIESNMAQKIYGQELIQDTDIPVHCHQTGAEKHSLEKGIPSLRVLFENRKYRCPRGDDESIVQTNAWIDEIQAWTFADGKVVSVGRHDDIAMAQWLCEIAIQRGESFSFAFGEQAGDAEAAKLLEEEERDSMLEAAMDPWIGLGLDDKDLDRGGGGSSLGMLDVDPFQRPDRPRHPLGGVPRFDDKSVAKILKGGGR